MTPIQNDTNNAPHQERPAIRSVSAREYYQCVFNAGKAAAISGMSTFANPYLMDGKKRQFDAWMDGYCSASVGVRSRRMSS